MRVSSGVEVIDLCGNMRTYSLPFAANVLLGSDTSGFDRLGLDPAAFQGLQAEIAKDDLVAASRVTFYTSSLAFSVLDPLGHQRHRMQSPRTYLG